MNIAELREAFNKHATNAGLSVECAMSGPLTATIAVIAEAPGRSEVAQGIPLVGASGNLLWTSLRRVCPIVKRQDVYVTNVVKRSLTAGFNETKKQVSKQELASWQQMLLWELSLLPNLKYVLLMGGMAIEACLGKKGALKWRGSVLPMTLEGKQLTAVCTVNAAACLHDPIQHCVFEMDLADKLKPVVNGTYSDYTVVTHINPTLSEVFDYINACEASDRPVASDIEVISNETACVGLGLTPHDAMCIPFRTETDHVWSINDELRIRRRLQNFYKAKRTRLVWQNGGFDAAWLWFKDRIYTKPAYSDTMLAHHVLYPPMPHDLGFIVKQYTSHAYYKDEKDDWHHTGGIDNFWRYNCRDCALTLASDIHIRHELKEQGLDRFYFEHVMRLQPHLVLMTVGGVLNDMGLREQMLAENVPGNLYDDLQRKLAALYAAIAEATGDPNYKPNPNSPKQMSDLYFTRLKLVGRGTSTDAENRRLMYKHPRTSDAAKRVLQSVDEYTRDHKFYSVYASAEPDYDQHMRCEYRQTGVKNAPGRLSSAKTLWGSGGNLQNIPDRAKTMFITHPDYVFIYIDGSQAEARVVGWRYVIESWMAQFERARKDGKYDAHRALAADMFNVPYDEVPTFDRYALDEQSAIRDSIPWDAARAGQPTIRYIAKRCRHGLNYRMMPDRLALTTGLPLATATEAYVKYHRLSPEVKQGWQHDLDLIKTKRALYSAYGRRYYQFAPISEETTESIVAFYHQSTIGDHICRVIYKSHDDDKWPRGKARIALNTHDGLVGIAHKSVAKQALRVMIKHAEAPISIIGVDRKTRQLIIPAEIGISQPDERGVHRWSTVKKMKVADL